MSLAMTKTLIACYRAHGLTIGGKIAQYCEHCPTMGKKQPRLCFPSNDGNSLLCSLYNQPLGAKQAACPQAHLSRMVRDLSTRYCVHCPTMGGNVLL